MEKEKCDCGKMATWWYMPGYSEGSSVHCDDCVPRGCECNHRYVDINAYFPPLDNPDLPTTEDIPYIWIEENKIWTHVDSKGREYPCCEYSYDIEGHENSSIKKNINN